MSGRKLKRVEAMGRVQAGELGHGELGEMGKTSSFPPLLPGQTVAQCSEPSLSLSISTSTDQITNNKLPNLSPPQFSLRLLENEFG